jgi:tRNA pseudouridine38-40 synthase
MSWKLTLSYKGTNFFGSQRQAGWRTVQEELERSLGGLAGRPVTTVFAGRTDRGVHAVGQVVGCDDIRSEFSGEALVSAINARLGNDLAVVQAERVEDSFHARYDAMWREYRFRIAIGVHLPLIAELVWQRRRALDMEAMHAGASRFLGTHDFATFAGGGEGVPWSERAGRPRGTVRTVSQCSVTGLELHWAGVAASRSLEIRVVADGFLPHMVRTMVAALVEIGNGSQSPEWIAELLEKRDRRQGPGTAPPHGLTLWRVGYGAELPDPDPDGTEVKGASVARTVIGIRE